MHKHDNTNSQTHLGCHRTAGVVISCERPSSCVSSQDQPSACVGMSNSVSLATAGHAQSFHTSPLSFSISTFLFFQNSSLQPFIITHSLIKHTLRNKDVSITQPATYSRWLTLRHMEALKRALFVRIKYVMNVHAVLFIIIHILWNIDRPGEKSSEFISR